MDYVAQTLNLYVSQGLVQWIFHNVSCGVVPPQARATSDKRNDLGRGKSNSAWRGCLLTVQNHSLAMGKMLSY